MSKSLIDMELLEKLQLHFSKANNVYLACLDRDGNELLSGVLDAAEKAFFELYITEQAKEHLYSNVKMSQVESIVEETLDVPYVKLCAVISRLNKSIALVWLVTAVIQEHICPEDEIPEGILCTSEEQFYRSVAFLETLSKQIFKLKQHELNAEEAMEKAVAAEEKYKEQMLHSEAMTRVVHLIELDEPFSRVCEQAIKDVCEILQIQAGCVLSIGEDGESMDVFCEHGTQKDWSIAERLQGQSKDEIPFFDGKPYMISSDSMMREDLETFFSKYHLNAGMFQPLEINGQIEGYLCFYEFEKSRIWGMDDMKFINDVKRVLQGILERRIAKNSLEDSHASLESVLENAGCAIYVVDYENKEVLYTNQKFRELIIKESDENGHKQYFFTEKNPEKAFPSREIYLKKNNIWLDMNQVEITWIDGRTVSLGTVYDITDKKLYQLEIERQVSIDNLTGLFNRIRCEKDLAAYIKEAEETGKEGAFLCIDINDFKSINEGLGHKYGDALLKAVAHNLNRVAGIEENCYRISGDEFAIIVQGKSYRELSRICKELREIFERPWFLKTEDFYCSMSMGVVCFPTDGNSVDDLNKKVTIALTAAKKKGKNSVEYYNEKIEDKSFYRLDMEQNLRRATLNSCNEFEIYYQPIIMRDQNGGRCCGAEALVRWNSTELGLILPEDFIPLAEFLGVINPIGEHVLSEAVKRCKYWNDCGHPDYKVSVNISAIQLLQPDFAAKVKQLLAKTHVNPQNVILEVTESLAFDDMERMKRALKQLKELGVKVALDDFGAGYSSLNHIRQIPIDMIKIDRCYIEDITEDAFAGAFVKMISELAKTMGMSVCVEGVEQKKQLEVLKDMHIDMIQGYYYGEPMPVKAFEKIYL